MSVTRQAVILVGGLGTRLGELTADIPKPLLPVAGSPFLHYIVASLVRHGFTDFLLLAGYCSQAVLRFAAEMSGYYSGVLVRVVVEDQPLGTGGALRNAFEFIEDEFLLLNGDTLFDFNFNDLVSPPLNAALARMALRRVSDTSRFGSILLSGNTVQRMLEKGANGPGLINGGVYLLSRACIEHLKEGVASLEKGLLPQLISMGLVEGREYHGFFLDIGVPDDYLAAQSLVPDSRRRGAVFFDRDGVLNEDLGYVSTTDRFLWIEGAKEAIKLCNDSGYYVFVITNQAGVARGFFNTSHVRALHNWMQDELRAAGAHVDRFYFCPHHPDFTGYCSCRKPEPGMILEALNEWPVVKGQSILVGDKNTDVDAATRAGIRGIRYSGGSLVDALRTIELSVTPPSK